MKINVKVWDWPLRLFHWLLVLAVTGSYVTGKLGGSLTDWHARLGGLVLGLLVFRVIWGFIGSTHARFANFFPTLSRLTAYFKGQWQGAGHNPAGAVAIIALLSILSFLIATGLFANDDIAFEGPLYSTIDKDLSDKLSGWHISTVNILIGLIGLHISAILFYQRVNNTNLIKAMLTGKKDVPKTLAHSSITPVHPIRFIAALLISASVVWGVWNKSILESASPLASLKPGAANQKT